MLQIPERTVGKGYPGLLESIRYSITDTHLTKKKTGRLNILSDFLEFSFFMDGCLSFQVQGHRKKLHAWPLQSHLAFNNGVEGTVEFSDERPLRCLAIHVPRMCLTEMISAQPRQNASARLVDIFEDDNRKFYCHVDTITKPMSEAVEKICACPGKSYEQALFIKAKSVELISLKLSQVSGEYGARKKQVCPRDKALIFQAARRLISRMADPPTLNELAKAVGISRTRLVVLFPMVFGETPFAFLRRERLSRAKMLLETEGKSVSEVAWEVGYSDTSPFHRAFVKEFGVKPGDCRFSRSMQYTPASAVAEV